MKYNYTVELNNILNNVYKELVYDLAKANPQINFSKNDLKNTKYILSKERVYLGSDMDDFIISHIPKGHDGNLFRVSISEYHNRLHPRFENYKGEPIVDSTYTKFALLLWEDHMNNLLIEDIQNLFSQNGFVDFINNTLDNYLEELSNRLNDYRNELIVIEFDSKENLLNSIADMIESNKLDFKFAHILVDIDKLRDDMAKMSATFNVYNEFDKLEDDPKQCLLKYPKYNSDELLDLLINNYDFKLSNNNCLTKNKH
ncbi:Uncharacterised protein [[Clostridium] sordellii]|uniref:hypothetical protein n=1 Tax=Paraclostridium sordellii TaxID=1505 RepID=UPI0005E18AE1|nr:hypothetical protein [Paeniclostridium sordellii]CEO04441.1 Uncharacterised protein [[Clostridium] sordellii] [Paeniclostridium sordellii]